MSQSVATHSLAIRITVAVLMVGLRAVGAPLAAEDSALGHPLSVWIARLDDRQEEMRWQAVCALGEIGSAAVQALPQLIRLLENVEEHEYVRGGAAWTMGRIGVGAQSAIPSLERALQSQQISVRRNAAQALGVFAVPATAESLLPCLDDEDEIVRIYAASSLWTICRESKAQTVLIHMLRDSDTAVACQAAMALGALPESQAVLPELLRTFHGDNEDVARAAAWAVGQMGPSVVGDVELALTDPATVQRQSLVDALRCIGTPAIDVLVKALTDREPAVRRGAARALGQLGSVARKALPAMQATLKDADSTVREEAGRAVARVRAVNPD